MQPATRGRACFCLSAARPPPAPALENEERETTLGALRFSELRARAAARGVAEALDVLRGASLPAADPPADDAGPAVEGAAP